MKNDHVVVLLAPPAGQTPTSAELESAVIGMLDG